jgi:hypothetical protein
MTKHYINLRSGLNSKPHLIPESEALEKYVSSIDKDWYVSLFRYTEEHKKYVEETGSVSGIRDTLTNNLYFDFDSKSDLENARNDALVTANRLLEKGIPEDAIGCYFTGNKGFSLEVTINDYLTPDQFKSIVFNLAGDLDTFDRVVNDPNRIVRLANTKHQTSGLYKINLSPEELTTLPIDEIKKIAKSPRKIENKSTVASLTPELNALLVKQQEKTIEKIAKELSFDTSSVDMKVKPKYLDESRWLLANGFFRTGERNHAMLCLAATYKNVGYAEEHTMNLLRGVSELQASRTGEELFPDNEIDLIINQVYSDNWKGGQFTTRDPNNWLSQYARKMGLNIVSDEGPMTLDGIESQFTHFVKNIEKNTIKTGIVSLDKLMPITVGSNIGVVAAAGAGKTALALKILKYNSKAGIPTVFASLDMHRNRLFEKVIYNVTGLSRDEVYKMFREGRGTEITAKVKEEYGNVWFYDRSSATVKDVKEYITDVEQKTGEKVKMVMFDYFERINTDVSDDTAASKKIANEIQDLIVDLDLAAITLCQPNKFSLGGGPDTEIKSYTSIKGSSFLYQSFRGIISLSRPFYTPSTKHLDNYMIINILKNDLGELDRLKFGWVGKTGEIVELEDHEKDELDELMKMKEAKKEGKNEWE